MKFWFVPFTGVHFGITLEGSALLYRKFLLYRNCQSRSVSYSNVCLCRITRTAITLSLTGLFRLVVRASKCRPSWVTGPAPQSDHTAKIIRPSTTTTRRTKLLPDTKALFHIKTLHRLTGLRKDVFMFYETEPKSSLISAKWSGEFKCRHNLHPLPWLWSPDLFDCWVAPFN